MGRGRAQALAVLLLAALLLAACGGGGVGDSQTLVIWTTEDLEDRVQSQRRILDTWEQKADVEIDLVAIAGDELTTVLASAEASGELPDAVAALSMNTVNQLRIDDLLDADAATQVVTNLGPETFVTRALELTRDGDAQISVPSDGWAQLLYYRTDLFQAAGLQPPQTYDGIWAAAQALNRGGDFAGIVAANSPADSFTEQTFDHVALANDCQLVNDNGDVTLDSNECLEAFQFYGTLLRDYSFDGNQDAETTRAAYFAGRAAMVVWSSFLLDELAGLQTDALPTCVQCAADSDFLVENTGVVQALQGPSGDEPAAFGEIVSWAIMRDAKPETTELVEYLMSDAYEDWLAIAPEGRIPVRSGTKDDPQEYVTAWKALPAGVDTKAPLSQFYGEATLEDIVTSPQTFDRWGLPQGHGELAGAVAGEFVVPRALAGVIGRGGDPADAMRQATAEAETIKADLGL